MTPSLQPQSNDPVHAYEQCVQAGKLKNDEAQRLVTQHLQALHNTLAEPTRRGLLAKLLKKGAAPRSIYIWGDVGRGKSLLMDMFYQSAPVASKQRTHFHALMLGIHAAVHAFRQQRNNDENPVEHVAKELAKRTRLVCLDEFQVTDVADAMILQTLFKTMLGAGVTFVITSNRPPEELYLGGLQREKFMDFVHLVYERMDVLELASPYDYRMQQIRAMQAVYMWPQTRQAEDAMQDIFAQLTHHSDLMPQALDVQGRKLVVNQSYGGIAKFTFDELCAKPLGSADYLAIARRFHTVFISGIPILAAENRNEARRFVTLIDTLYDHRVKLVCTAAAEPKNLYASGDGSFEFHRTVSRLSEMQSAEYLAAVHIP